MELSLFSWANSFLCKTSLDLLAGGLKGQTAVCCSLRKN